MIYIGESNHLESRIPFIHCRQGNKNEHPFEYQALDKRKYMPVGLGTFLYMVFFVTQSKLSFCKSIFESQKVTILLQNA